MFDSFKTLRSTLVLLVRLTGLLSWGLLFWLPMCSHAQVNLAGHRVLVFRVNTQDRSLFKLPSPSSIGTKSIVLEPGTTVGQLLLSNGIAPDVGAYGLLYSLNPEIKSETDLQHAKTLTIPVVSGNLTFPPNSLLSFSLDRDLVDQLRSATRDLSSALEGINPSLSAEASIQRLQDCEHWLQTIARTFQQRRGPVTSRETLDHLVREANLLAKLARKGRQKLTEPQVSQLDALHADIRREIVRFDDIMAGAPPGPESRYLVIVNILGQAENAAPLRVYYTLNGLFQDPPTDPPVRSIPFPMMGSGSRNFLPAKNYRVWAAPDGQPGKPATPRLLFELRAPVSEGISQVDLSIIK